MGLSAMERTMSPVTSPPEETPIKTSAPRRTSARDPRRAARVCQRGQLRLVAGEALAPGANRPAPVADDDVARAEVEQHPADGRTRGPGSVYDDAAFAKFPAREPQGVGQRGGDDDGRAVLVVVKDGDVQGLRKPALYLKAARRGDVLQVYAAERGRGGLHRGDDLVRVLRIQTERDGVHAAELLEEQGLALHDGQGGQGANRYTL